MISPHVHIPFDRIPQHVDFINEKRLNLEIYFSSDALDTLTGDDVSSIRNRLGYQPSLSVHAPFMDLSPGAVDSKVRHATMERFNQILDLSEILKPEAVVFHSGYEKWKYALHVDLWLEKSLLTWQAVNKRASDIGVKVAIENIFEDNPENLRVLMEHMNSKNFGICFDTGHLNLFNKVKLDDWMDALNPYILELHLHDNNRTSDQHLALGEGTFDFKKFFGLLQNKDCIYANEAHSPENVLKSMEYLRKMSI